ncbi:hypothetical protein [Agromyces sp. NPDC058104]|uniref:hypothetical protein n=1 Tax=Agromyces sp. NPDC058104 TaxID=3346342 RepID=UPI0036DA55A7
MTNESDPTPAPKRFLGFTPKQLAAVGAIALVALAIGSAVGYAATQPQVASAQDAAADAQGETDDLASKLSDAEDARDKASTDARAAQGDLAEATATIDKLMAGRDPVVLTLDFPVPDGYPTVVDISAVPEHMRDSLGTPKAVAVAPGVWAAFPPGATVESAVNAKAFDGYCASKLAFEEQYLGGESTSGSCW